MIHRKRIWTISIIAIVVLVALATFQLREGPIVVVSADGGPPRIEIAEETMWAAKHSGFDYRRQIDAAVRGNEKAILALFRFSQHTDAASALGHGVALVELFEAIGDEVPARVAMSLNPEEKRYLPGLLEAGVAYGLHIDPDDWRNRYPHVFSVLKDSLARPQ